MTEDRLSQSVFTIEVDRKPVIAFSARKYRMPRRSVPTRGYAPNSARLYRAENPFAMIWQR
jgi:hypothetical protein